MSAPLQKHFIHLFTTMSIIFLNSDARHTVSTHCWKWMNLWEPLSRVNTKLKLWFHVCNSFSGNALFSLSLIIPSFALISLAALILAPGNAGCYKAQSNSFLTWRRRQQNNLVSRSWFTDMGVWIFRFQMKFTQMLQLTEVFYASSNGKDWLGLTYPLLANWNFALHSYIMQR